MVKYLIKISIIIPTLNEEKYITKTLDSLKKQVMKDDEIIVIDSYSNDNTVKFAKKFGAKVYQTPRCGIGPAKTLGAIKSCNEYLAFLDADGIPDEIWLKRIRTCFNDPIIDSVGGVDLYDSDSLILMILYNIYSLLVFITGLLYYKMMGYPWMPWNNCAIKKQTFLEKGGLRNVICEDYDFAQRAKGIKTIYDIKMKVILSDRRFRNEGFLKTLWLWVKSDYAILRNRKKIESTCYEIIR
jgi:glycosyltransferase involved in cell wall biosynthesis